MSDPVVTDFSVGEREKRGLKGFKLGEEGNTLFTVQCQRRLLDLETKLAQKELPDGAKCFS